MSKIRVTNPYFEKEYKVVEGRGDIEYKLVRIQQGLKSFLLLHTPDGDTLTINPSNFASIEIGDTE
jgi:hypothetical protein